MKNILIALLLFPIFAFSQDTPVIVIDCDKRASWRSGDAFVGINSPATETSFLNLKLSPNFGYAISDKEMVYLGGWYYDSDPSNFFVSGGYNRLVYGSAFLGVGAYYKDTGINTSWGMNARIGLHREIVKNVYVSPSIEFAKQFDSDEPFSVYTNISFGLRI